MHSKDKAKPERYHVIFFSNVIKVDKSEPTPFMIVIVVRKCGIENITVKLGKERQSVNMFLPCWLRMAAPV